MTRNVQNYQEKILNISKGRQRYEKSVINDHTMEKSQERSYIPDLTEMHECITKTCRKNGQSCVMIRLNFKCFTRQSRIPISVLGPRLYYLRRCIDIDSSP